MEGEVCPGLGCTRAENRGQERWGLSAHAVTGVCVCVCGGGRSSQAHCLGYTPLCPLPPVPAHTHCHSGLWTQQRCGVWSPSSTMERRVTSEKSLPLSEPQFPQLQMETMKPLLLTLLGAGAGKPHTACVTRSRGSVTPRWLHPDLGPAWAPEPRGHGGAAGGAASCGHPGLSQTMVITTRPPPPPPPGRTTGSGFGPRTLGVTSLQIFSFL